MSQGSRPLRFVALRGDGHVTRRFVAGAARGRGVATALLAAAEIAARRRGCRRLTADASLMLKPVLARRGWRVLRRETVVRNGRPLVRFAMRQSITPARPGRPSL